jgi:hypothetical protein
MPAADAMPSSDIVFTGGLLLVAVVPSLIAFWIQRGVSKVDTNAAEKAAELVQWKASMEARMSAAEEKAHAQDLSIQERVTRADLDRITKDVFTEIKSLGDKVDAKFDTLQAAVMRVLQGPHN